jgi:hypothetical protein
VCSSRPMTKRKVAGSSCGSIFPGVAMGQAARAGGGGFRWSPSKGAASRPPRSGPSSSVNNFSARAGQRPLKGRGPHRRGPGARGGVCSTQRNTSTVQRLGVTPVKRPPVTQGFRGRPEAVWPCRPRTKPLAEDGSLSHVVGPRNQAFPLTSGLRRSPSHRAAVVVFRANSMLKRSPAGEGLRGSRMDVMGPSSAWFATAGVCIRMGSMLSNVTRSWVGSGF